MKMINEINIVNIDIGERKILLIKHGVSNENT